MKEKIQLDKTLNYHAAALLFITTLVFHGFNFACGKIFNTLTGPKTPPLSGGAPQQLSWRLLKTFVACASYSSVWVLAYASILSAALTGAIIAQGFQINKELLFDVDLCAYKDKILRALDNRIDELSIGHGA